MTQLHSIAATTVTLLCILLAGSALGQGPAVNDALTFSIRPEPLVAPIDDQILTVAFAPDGKKLFGAGARPQKPGQFIVWDVETGQAIVTMRGITGVRSLAVSPDGTKVATGDFGGNVRLRDAATGAELAAVKGHAVGVNGVAFAPDGSSIVSAGLDQVVKLWDVEGLKERATFRGHTGMVYTAAFFNHGKTFVTGAQDATARIWDVAGGAAKLTLKGHLSAVEAVAVSPDDKLIATASWDRTVKLWDAQTGTEVTTFLTLLTPIYFVAFSPDGKQLAGAASDGTLHLWDVAEKKWIGGFERHGANVWAVAFSRDGKTLASGSSDKTAKIWDVATRKEIRTLDASASLPPVRTLVYAPDGKTVAIATHDSIVQIRNAETGALLRRLAGHADVVNAVAFAPDGQTIATASADQTIKLWDSASGAEKLTLEGHPDATNAVAFAPDGTLLASGGEDKTVRLWDIAEGKKLAELEGHTAAVHAVVFARDGKQLASGSADNSIKVWDVDKRAATHTLAGHGKTLRALAFAPDGTLISAGNDGLVKLWDLQAGTERKVLKGHNGEVLSLAISPGGRTLISGGADRTVRVWDPRSGGMRGIMSRHQQGVNALAFHPGGRQFFSGSTDATVQRWVATATGTPPVNLQAHPTGAWFAAYSPAGDRLATGGGGGAITLWRQTLTPGQAPPGVGQGSVWDVAYSPDGQSFAVATPTGVLLCDALSGQLRHALELGEAARSVAFSPDSTLLAVGPGAWSKAEEPAVVRVYRCASGAEIARLGGHGGMIFRVAFSPDGKTLATACKDKTMRLWDVPSFKQRTTLQGQGNVKGMAFLPDGTLVAASWDATIRLWDCTRGQELRSWNAGMPMASLAISPDSKLLASSEAGAERKEPTPIVIWETATGKELHRLAGHTGRILGLAFTHDGRSLVSAGGTMNANGELIEWDYAAGLQRAAYKTPRQWLENVVISPDNRRLLTASQAGLQAWDFNLVGQERAWAGHNSIVSCGLFIDDNRLVTGGFDKAIKVWDLTRKEAVATLKHEGTIRGLAVVPDRNTLVSAGEDKVVKLWDLTTFKLTRALDGHTRPVLCVAVAPDGATMASGGGDIKQPGGSGELILWDLAGNKPPQVTTGFKSPLINLAYAPDGATLIASFSAEKFDVLDAATGKLRVSHPLPYVRPVGFSPDGRTLAVGFGKAPSPTEPGNGGVRLYDTATWRQRALFIGHGKTLFTTTFAPDGRTLATASEDGTVKLWTVPQQQDQLVVVNATPPAQPTFVRQAAAPVAMPVPPARVEVTTPRAPPSRAWIPAVELLAMVLTLAVMSGWFFVRGRIDSGPVDTPAAPVTSAPRAIAVVCQHCGKEMKARAGLAGKKVKCVVCGEVVRVPAS